MPRPLILTKLPYSGDTLTDWFFRQLVFALNEERVIVSRKRRLTDPDDRSRTAVRGLMDPLVHPSGAFVHILINPARDANRTRDEEVETLIHELVHVMMPLLPERRVLQLESILAGRLSTSQRRYLKRFLPRHVVKRYPSMPAGRLATMPLAAHKKRRD